MTTTEKLCARCGEFPRQETTKSYCRGCYRDVTRGHVARHANRVKASRADWPDEALWELAARLTGGWKWCPYGEHTVRVQPGSWYLFRGRTIPIAGYCTECTREAQRARSRN